MTSLLWTKIFSWTKTDVSLFLLKERGEKEEKKRKEERERGRKRERRKEKQKNGSRKCERETKTNHFAVL